MAAKKRILNGVVALAVASGLGAFAWHSASRGKPLTVTVETVARGLVEQTVSAISAGTVMPQIDSKIAAETVGAVASVRCREGDRVQPGQPLIELNHTETDAQVALAMANLQMGSSKLQQAKIAAAIYADIAATRVAQAKVQMEQARSDYARLKALKEKNAISQSELDKAALALRVAEETSAAAIASQHENGLRQEEVRSAESAVEQLKAAVAVAEAVRDKAFVRAPFAGIVADIFVDQGEGVGLGFPLLQLVDDSAVYVEAPFDEANAADIKVGQKARIGIDAYRNVAFQGEVEYIAPVVRLNPDRSRTLTVRIRALERPEVFLGGMSADVTILVDEKDGVLAVSSEAIVREQYVFLVERGRAVRRDIQRGIGNWNKTEILGGLKEGDTIVRSIGIKGLVDGSRLRIVEEPAS